MGTKMWEEFLPGVETVLRLEAGTWSMVKRLWKATNEYHLTLSPPPPAPPIGSRQKFAPNDSKHDYPSDSKPLTIEATGKRSRDRHNTRLSQRCEQRRVRLLQQSQLAVHSAEIAALPGTDSA